MIDRDLEDAQGWEAPLRDEDTSAGQVVAGQRRMDATMLGMGDVDLDTLEEWLTVVMASREMMKANGRHLFTPWERSFVVSIDEEYNAKHLAGFHHRPLTRKQIFYLHRMYLHLAADTAEQMGKSNE